MSEPTFVKWPSTPRLNRDMIITEKIDGTNAAVIIETGLPSDPSYGWCAGLLQGGNFYKVGAQSRKRVITPEQDNFGFAQWVQDNAPGLVELLGPGYHYGEWWGSGIQRGYGLLNGHRVFSLFNVNRYADHLYDEINGEPLLFGLEVVPEIHRGPFDMWRVERVMDELRSSGSYASPGYMNPEGIIVYHTAARQVFKVTFDHDQEGKPA